MARRGVIAGVGAVGLGLASLVPGQLEQRQRCMGAAEAARVVAAERSSSHAERRCYAAAAEACAEVAYVAPGACLWHDGEQMGGKTRLRGEAASEASARAWAAVRGEQP